MTLKEQINEEKLPKHIAIIMDGNGRWAKQRGNRRLYGHKNGVRSVREVVEAAGDLGIKYLTLYAFSTENWRRPMQEINALMTLLISTLNSESKTLIDNNIRLLVIGDVESLPSDVGKKLKETISSTEKNTGLYLVLALSYSARWEIINAVKKIGLEIERKNILPGEITDDVFNRFLETSNIPDPELLIRTSGEYRISNFLLWQLAYTELYFTEVLWPDFRKENFYQAILDFQKRERRFGKISEQLKK